MPSARSTCTFCHWSDNQYRYPGHLINKHLERIKLTNTYIPHCITGYVSNKGSITEFGVCLTCKKGTMCDLSSGHGARWVALHAKNRHCRVAHAAAYVAFKERYTRVIAMMKEAGGEDPIPPTTPIKCMVDATTQTDDLPINKLPEDDHSDTGYLYCFSNSSMPGILKIGMTLRTPQIRLNEANTTNTWKPPTDYVIEFAKRVTEPLEKEKIIHQLLATYTERINSRREFFRISTDAVRVFFDLMDGDYWINN